jgi:hypothetical protein
VIECPRCSGSLEEGAAVCRHCLLVLDREVWQHDAGRLGADGRGAGDELEDPPVEPIPITGSGLAGGELGAATAGFRLLATDRLLKRRKRRQSDA